MRHDCRPVSPHALAEVSGQDLNRKSQLIRAVIWHAQALNLFKEIHSYTAIRTTH